MLFDEGKRTQYHPQCPETLNFPGKLVWTLMCEKDVLDDKERTTTLLMPTFQPLFLREGPTRAAKSEKTGVISLAPFYRPPSKPRRENQEVQWWATIDELEIFKRKYEFFPLSGSHEEMRVVIEIVQKRIKGPRRNRQTQRDIGAERSHS